MRLVKGLLARCVEVIELMAARGVPCRLSDVADALGLPKSAAHRLLQELRALGWIEQDAADERYRLSLGFALLGGRALHASGLPDLVQPVLQGLADRTQELVRLTIATGDGLAWFAAAQGAPPGLLYQPTMDRAPLLHATANGKAYLATLPNERALRLAVRAGLGRIRPTPRTLSDPRALLADLARVRARGYATAIEEAELGVTAVAVAVGSEPRGTLSVAGPSLRLSASRVPTLADALCRTAASLVGAWPSGARPVSPPARAKAPGGGERSRR